VQGKTRGFFGNKVFRFFGGFLIFKVFSVLVHKEDGLGIMTQEEYPMRTPFSLSHRRL